MMVRVKVRASPYYALKRGTVGEVVERKYIGTPFELLKVRFKGGVVWSFHPDEVEEIV